MMAEFSQTMLAFIRENTGWAGPAACAIAFAASVLGPSFFIPASLILVAVGVMVGAGLVSWWIVLWAGVGAVAGSTISYALGAWAGPAARRSWPLKNRAETLERARTLYVRHGFAAVLVGYFSGPLRAPVAFVAGIAGMTHARFQLANAASAALWAPFVVGEGAILGAVLGSDHPLFLAAPLVAPLLALGVMAMIAALWRMMKKHEGKWQRS